MKPTNPSLLALAALLCGGLPAAAQSENELENSVEALKAEIAAIEDEAAERRAELADLEKRAAERADEARDRNEADRRIFKRWIEIERGDFPGWPKELQGFSFPAQAPQRWVIGVAIAQDDGEDGVRIVRSMEDSPAREAGVRDGDRIVAVNDIDIRGVDALRAIINAAGDQKLMFTVSRGEEEIELAITPEENREAAEARRPRPGGPGQPQWEFRGGDLEQFFREGDAPLDELRGELDELRKLVEDLVGEIEGDAGEKAEGEDAAADDGEAEE